MTTSLTLGTNENAFRVWTGERPVEEVFLDVFYRANRGVTNRVRLYRWQGRILRAPPGAT